MERKMFALGLACVLVSAACSAPALATSTLTHRSERVANDTARTDDRRGTHAHVHDVSPHGDSTVAHTPNPSSPTLLQTTGMCQF